MGLVINEKAILIVLIEVVVWMRESVNLVVIVVVSYRSLWSSFS